jgi:hypothetical protein
MEKLTKSQKMINLIHARLGITLPEATWFQNEQPSPYMNNWRKQTETMVYQLPPELAQSIPTSFASIEELLEKSYTCIAETRDTYSQHYSRKTCLIYGFACIQNAYTWLHHNKTICQEYKKTHEIAYRHTFLEKLARVFASHLEKTDDEVLNPFYDSLQFQYLSLLIHHGESLERSDDNILRRILFRKYCYSNIIRDLYSEQYAYFSRCIKKDCDTLLSELVAIHNEIE